ncbi:hypothetical protein Cgig2_022177 [Carnegiea gigantea]|uniref:Uncharacterized protein n=1 Tax=Carnegiea gigantea TaxID=171969 RepID=A0A9Q1JJU4_9CARY|nr:hypothetical protein Cgig2_022177 [Carnegiea gigantea]
MESPPLIGDMCFQVREVVIVTLLRLRVLAWENQVSSPLPIFAETGTPNLPKLPSESIIAHFQGVMCSFFMHLITRIWGICEFPLVTSLDERTELSVVKETPLDGSCIMASPEASTDNDNSRSTIIQTSEFGQENFASCSMDITPERDSLAKGFMPETVSSVNLSVNSHAHKRRVSLNSLLINSIQEKKLNVTSGEVTENFEEMGYSVRNGNENQITKFASKKNSSESELASTIPSPSLSDDVDKSLKFPSLSLNRQLQIFCSLCKSALGRPETIPYVMCCLTLLSKAIFAPFSQGKGLRRGHTSASLTHVLIVDISSVDQRLCSRNNKNIPGQGIWCPEDGCVYNSIFCPFCISPNHCLGFQIVAADASNFQLINKILFYYDRLEVKTDAELEKKDASTENGSCADGTVDIHSLEKYTNHSPQQSSGGWRMTKPKVCALHFMNLYYLYFYFKLSGSYLSKILQSRLPQRSPSLVFDGLFELGGSEPVAIWQQWIHMKLLIIKKLHFFEMNEKCVMFTAKKTIDMDSGSYEKLISLK